MIVDYIGIAPQLKEALATYTAANGKGGIKIDTSEAVRILLEQIQIAEDGSRRLSRQRQSRTRARSKRRRHALNPVCESANSRQDDFAITSHVIHRGSVCCPGLAVYNYLMITIRTRRIYT